jgi:hypothetical protein
LGTGFKDVMISCVAVNASTQLRWRRARRSIWTKMFCVSRNISRRSGERASGAVGSGRGGDRAGGPDRAHQKPDPDPGAKAGCQASDVAARSRTTRIPKLNSVPRHGRCVAGRPSWSRFRDRADRGRVQVLYGTARRKHGTITSQWGRWITLKVRVSASRPVG